MLLGLLLQAAPAAAHLVLAHAAQYGRNGPNLHPVTPQLNEPFEKWWFKGNLPYPPKQGVIMNLPAGGTLTASLTCSNGNPKPNYDGYTCGNNVSDAGSTHTKDKMNTPIDKLVDVRGCGLSIAYESDATKLQPEDFAVISVNYSCPWVQANDFRIPADLPACPPGGCTCMWGWIHSPNAGGQPEMYTMAYSCNVTGATGTAPVPKPRLARKCPIDRNNCTVGPKQMHYWVQKERNNNFQAHNDPPFYNGDYGFMDGAQTDLWSVPDETLYADNCDWAPGPQLFDGPWSNLASGRPQWDGVQPQPLKRVYPTPVNCTSTKTATSSAASSTAMPWTSLSSSVTSAVSSAATSASVISVASSVVAASSTAVSSTGAVSSSAGLSSSAAASSAGPTSSSVAAASSVPASSSAVPSAAASSSGASSSASASHVESSTSATVGSSADAAASTVIASSARATVPASSAAVSAVTSAEGSFTVSSAVSAESIGSTQVVSISASESVESASVVASGSVDAATAASASASSASTNAEGSATVQFSITATGSITATSLAASDTAVESSVSAVLSSGAIPSSDAQIVPAPSAAISTSPESTDAAAGTSETTATSQDNTLTPTKDNTLTPTAHKKCARRRSRSRDF